MIDPENFKISFNDSDPGKLTFPTTSKDYPENVGAQSKTLFTTHKCISLLNWLSYIHEILARSNL